MQPAKLMSNSPFLAVLRLMLAIVATVPGCGRDVEETGGNVVQIHLPPETPAGSALTMAADDLASALLTMGQASEVLSRGAPSRCVGGEQHIVVLQPELAGQTLPVEDPQQFRIVESRCRDGRLVLVRGGGLPSTQWALYALAEALGVRFLHPEQTWYPRELLWPDVPLAIDERPSVRGRSFHAHRTHPIELSAPLNDDGLDMQGIQRRWVTWNVARRQTRMDGVDERYVGTLPFDRGMIRTGGFSLSGTQQGGVPILNPDDPRSESDQIAEAIDAVLEPRTGEAPVTRFGFQFNTTEFNVDDEALTLQRIEFVTEYIVNNYPGVEVWTINHGTAQEPGPVFGIRPFDISSLARPELGVSAHTLMFYDLERGAPVYGNTSFNFLREFIEDQYTLRRIEYYPETSWWLTFDLPVPLYLAPVSLDARESDFGLLAPWLATSDDATTGVVSHHVFTSGQEWGYWLIDLCTAEMAWDVELSWLDCVGWAFDGFAGRDTIVRVLGEVADRQISDMRNPDVLRMLVGSDDETEAAADLGIVFHPLPPRIDEILGWSDAEASAFRANSLDPLGPMAAGYHEWADEIEALLPGTRQSDAVWLREIRDGLRMFALRAEHSLAVYTGAVEVRDAASTGDVDALLAVGARLLAARAITDEAAAVVVAREDDYRYPDELTIAGDEPGTPGAVANATIYPYRVLSRTHRLHYWHRPNELLATMLERSLNVVEVNDRIIPVGQALVPRVLLAGLESVMIDWGDTRTSTEIEPHTYIGEGLYDWSLVAEHAEGVLNHDDTVAIVARRFVFPRGSFEVVAPLGADIIAGVLPGFVLGLGTDIDGQFFAIGRLDSVAEVAALDSVVRRSRLELVSDISSLGLVLPGVGPISVIDAALTLEVDTVPLPVLTIDGRLATSDVIGAVVSVGGFDREGATNLVASLLGFTPETLPPQVEFRIRSVGREGNPQ